MLDEQAEASVRSRDGASVQVELDVGPCNFPGRDST